MLYPRKIILFVNKGVFLSFIINENGISANPYKVAAVRNRPMLRIIIEIRGFINAAVYFRNLINNYAAYIDNLTNYYIETKEAAISLSLKAQKE